MFNVDVHRIEGKAFVAHADDCHDLDLEIKGDWLAHEDCFHVRRCSSLATPHFADLKQLPHRSLQTCLLCRDEHIQSLLAARSTSLHCTKLRGLELFAGAGGLSAGLEQSGFVDTRWVVEWMTSAAMTYK